MKVLLLPDRVKPFNNLQVQVKMKRLHEFRMVAIYFVLSLLVSCSLPAVSEPAQNYPASTVGVPSTSTSFVPVTGSPTSAKATPAPIVQNTPLPSNAQPTQVPASPVPQAVWKEWVTGLKKPVDLAEIPDGSGRLAVIEQAGMIRIITKDGKLSANPFLDIHARVGSQGTEQGLLGMAFHPKFSENGFLFVNYTDVNGNTVIARFKGAPQAAQIDSASEKVLLQVKQPYPNHNGGGVVFGPDGYLYLSLGDGGSSGDPQNHAQSLDTYLGKILRIDVNQGDRYGIPVDNPFAKNGGLPEIWAYGLRNPWRFSFDLQTHDLYIADVGQNLYEEVNFIPAGGGAGYNYGWRYREGLHAYKDNPPASLKLVDPIFEYSHDLGCSITGGFVYRGKRVPGLVGTYLVGDYCSGRIWGLKRNSAGAWQSQVLFNSKAGISSFGQDLNGEIYLMDINQGRVLRLEQN
jgi:glucose/arabinose dehydrogenase